MKSYFVRSPKFYVCVASHCSFSNSTDAILQKQLKFENKLFHHFYFSR